MIKKFIVESLLSIMKFGCEESREWSGSLLDRNELVLYVWMIFARIDLGNAFLWKLHLSPSINLKSQVFADHVRMAVADGDHCSLLDDIKLFVLGNHVNTAILVSHKHVGLSDHWPIISLPLHRHFHAHNLSTRSTNYHFVRIITFRCMFTLVPGSSFEVLITTPYYLRYAYRRVFLGFSSPFQLLSLLNINNSLFTT